MKHPKTKADKKNRPQDSGPRVSVYIRVGSASQLGAQAMGQQPSLIRKASRPGSKAK